MNEKEALIALNMVPGVGSVRVNRLIGAFGSAAAVFGADADRIKDVDGIGEEIGAYLAGADLRRLLEKEQKEAAERGIRIITVLDDDYPEKLKNIYDPPPVLYSLGGPIPAFDLAIGIVGTRMATDYGSAAVKLLARQMKESSARFIVVSGMARGIDSVAHMECIKNGIFNIAVLGFGMNRIMPLERYELPREIIKKGMVVTEFPMNMIGLKQNFPRRNRVISGLSDGIVVVEAPERSGALITSDQALEQNREVFAVPGNIFAENSTGVHNLIKQGAKLIAGVNDIIDEFRMKTGRIEVKVMGEKRDEVISTLAGDEKKIFCLLGAEKKHVDNIAIESNIDIIKLNGILTMLELKGYIRQLSGKNFVRNI